MGKILARGHSRVPVYSGNPKNVIGLLLVTMAYSYLHVMFLQTVINKKLLSLLGKESTYCST